LSNAISSSLFLGWGAASEEVGERKRRIEHFTKRGKEEASTKKKCQFEKIKNY